MLKKLVYFLFLLGAVALAVFVVWIRKGSVVDSAKKERIAAVEVTAIERRSMERERTLSGALEAEARLVVAPKVGGRIEKLMLDLADPVERGQVVAVLDDDEFAQAVIQAEAELAVAKANRIQAENALKISRRENDRIVELRERGISSDSEYDLALSDLLEKEARFQVAEAQVSRAEAIVEAARIRLDYTNVRAEWPEGDSSRMVAERYVDEGETVAANDPLFLIVRLDPIVAVISVTERDYGLLKVGQSAQFRTDAFPGEIFHGRIARIAPVFRQSSRQARVELSLPNPDGRLKPGMFVRASIILERAENVVAVPEAALARRGQDDGIFLVNGNSDKVRWVVVEPGIRDKGWVQILGQDLSGDVVTLGQQLVDDGAPIRITEIPESGIQP